MMSEDRRLPNDEREAYRIDAQLLSDLWIFRAAARFGSITAAARHLNVTQGAVSQRVLRLEARMDTELFRRHKGKITLTEAGSTVLEAMNTVAVELDEALGRIDQSRRCALVVSCSPSLATEWLMPHLQDFYRECPHVELLVRAEMAAPSVGWMEEERIDLLIEYRHSVPADLVQLASLQELTFPVCARAFRARLDGLPADQRVMVVMHDDAAWREGEAEGAEWQEWLDAVGDRRGVAIKGERHFNLAYLAYQAAIYGQGVAMGRSISVNRLLRSKDLVAAFDIPPIPSAHHRVLSRTPVSTNSPAAQFVAWIERAWARTQQDTLDILKTASKRSAR